MSQEEFGGKVLQKEKGMVRALRVKITFKDAKKPAEVSFFEGTVRIKGFAFRQFFGFAGRIIDEVSALQELCAE